MKPIPFLFSLFLLLLSACTCRDGGGKRDCGRDGSVDMLLSRAERLMYSSNPDSSIVLLDSAEACVTSRKLNPHSYALLARIKGGRAQLQHFRSQDSPLTIDLYRQSIDLWRLSDRPEGMVYATANMGDVFKSLSSLPEAVTCYRRALLLADSLHVSTAERISVELGLGSVYTSLHDWAAARRCYENVARHRDELRPHMQAYFLNDYGNYFYYKEDYGEALRLFLSLDSLYQRQTVTDEGGWAVCRVNLADVYLNLNDTANAARFLRLAQEEFERQDNPAGLFYCRTIAIGLALKRHDVAEVRRILDSEPADRHVEFNLRNIRSAYLRDYFSQTGSWREAYEILEKELQYNDSLHHNQEILRTVTIIEEMKGDTMRLHQQIGMAQKDLAVSRVQNHLNVALTALVLLALAFALWVMRTRHREAKNRIDLMQLRLTNLRNRISPHFILNILSDKIVNSDEEQADQLTHLSQVLRTGLDLAGKSEVTLAEELDFLRDYVDTERYKLRPDFRFSVTVDAGIDTDSVRLPSMLVQILVENAIRHGLKKLERAQELSLHVSRKHERAVCIAVADNGPGFDVRAVPAAGGHFHTGLAVVSRTILIYNAQHRHKMHFDIHNTVDAAGNVSGCLASLTVPTA